MKTKDKISLSFTGVLVVCAIIITGLVLNQEFFPPEPQPQTRQVENWQQLDLTGQHIGPTDAPVQIVEFFDYECPFCKKANPVVQAIMKKYPRQVSVGYEHFPLGGHEYAFDAALAAECAGHQEVFSSYHNLLFSYQDSLGMVSYTNLAQLAKIPDVESFNKCVEYEETSDIVKSGMALAEKLEISSIPTFIINGKLVAGALPKEHLESLIQKALSKANQ